MKSIEVRYGLLMFVGFTGFFLFMHLLNLSDNYFLRYFNAVIHGVVLWFALRAWATEQPGMVSNYPYGVAVGMVTSLAGLLPFTVFMAIFLGFSPDFMAHIQSQSPMGIGQYFTPVTASVFILMEGLIGALIGSYIMVRILEIKVRGELH